MNGGDWLTHSTNDEGIGGPAILKGIDRAGVYMYVYANYIESKIYWILFVRKSHFAHFSMIRYFDILKENN